MFEVGTESDKEHRLIVDYLEKNPFGTAYLVGKNFFKHNTSDSNIHQFETFEVFSKFLKEHPLQDAFILIKGSRGMALERVLNLL
jgi:UDP-N-acetylmuramoyl-tripeptide--D-alanyl-D-alanine ligase